MKSRNSKSIVLYSALVGLGLCFGAASGAMAQQPAQKADETAQSADQKVVASDTLQQQAQRTPVTGSNIKRVRPADPSLPLLELDRAYIDRTGGTNPAEVLRTVPQVQVAPR